MVAHGPLRRMGRCVHFSALAPVRIGPMCVITHVWEAPSDERSKDPQDPYLIELGLCGTSILRSSRNFGELPFWEVE